MSSLPLFTLVSLTALTSACGALPVDDPFFASGGDGIELGDLGGDDAADADADADAAGGSADGGDPGDGDLDGGVADDDGVGPDCTLERFDRAIRPPSVMLVLDKSSSMSDERWLHGDSGGDSGGDSWVTRWSSLHGVVSDLVTAYDATIDFGATLFPAADSGHWRDGFTAACGVAERPDVATGPGASAAILAALPGPEVAVQGATPASGGMMTALTHLALETSGPRAVVLVTDGLANCAHEAGDEMFLYDEGLPTIVEAAYQELGIPTYVVGIDIRDEVVGYAGANAHEVLDQVARVGGVPREGSAAYYAAGDEAALDEAMDQIAARIACTVPLDAPVPADATFEVRVDGKPQAEVEDCAAEDGWRFTDDAARTTIELCGTACDGLRVAGTMETRTCEDDALPPVP